MTTLSDTYTPVRPAEYRTTILDTGEDLLDYHLDGGLIPDADENVRLRDGQDVVTVPIRGLYRLQRIENGIPAPGPGVLLTAEQFAHRFRAFAEPSYEYGIWARPRRGEVVNHGTAEAAQSALDSLPVLKASGDYRIVRRLASEEHDWELLPA